MMNLQLFSQGVTQANSKGIICISRTVAERIVADLEQYDATKLQVATLMEMCTISDSINARQEQLINDLEHRLKTCNDHVSEIEQVLTDQTAAYNALSRKHKKDRRRLYLVVGGLFGALILTNL